MPRQKSGKFDQKGYMNQYITEHIIYRRINFKAGDEKDQAMIAWIDSHKNGEGISNYIKRLISEDMKKVEDS